MTQPLNHPNIKSCENPFGLLSLEDDLRILAADERFLQIFDCKLDEILNNPLETLFNDQNRKAVTDFHRKLSSYQSGFIELDIEFQLNSGNYYVFMRLSKTDKHWFAWVENLQGSQAGVIGDLFSSQDRYKSVLKNSGDGIVLLNAKNELIEFNKSFFDILAIQNKQGILLDEAAITGKNFFDLAGNAFSEVQSVISNAQYSKRAQLGFPVDFQNYSLTVDITPIFQPVIGYTGCGMVIHDQTAQIKLEKRAKELAENEIKLIKEQEAKRVELEFQLRQAQKMEAIGQLTGGIAHDFNNILTSILGNASLSLETAQQQADEQLIKYQTNLIRSAERAKDLIAQMLIFSRGQRGEFKATPLTDVVHEAIKLLELSLPSSVQIHVSIEDLSSPVKHDALQIEQVLMNLCMNAHHAMEGTGHIHIRQSRKQTDHEICSSCSHKFSGNYVVLSISDNGCGIEQGIMERMFEPFYTTKEIGKGSGMGLAMAHGIVHEHNGHIVVKSIKNQGATFSIMLPVDTQTIEPGLATSLEHEKQGNRISLKGSVMVVDDEALVAEFMQDLLQSRGMKVTTVTNSIEALNLYQNNPAEFDLVITDQTMPDMTGMKLAKHLLEINPDLAIILYTGHSENLSPQQVANQGIKGFLKKPVDIKLLMQTLQQLTSKENSA